jgi:hypothetical protein
MLHAEYRTVPAFRSIQIVTAKVISHRHDWAKPEVSPQEVLGPSNAIGIHIYLIMIHSYGITFIPLTCMYCVAMKWYIEY